MDQQRLALTCAFIMVGLLTSVNASAQSSTAPSRRDTPQAVPRTPDGRPDLQGTWTNPYTATPLERPAQLADKAFFTEQEARDWENGAYQRLLKALPAPELTGELLWLDEWKVAESRRTSLIVDPPTGKVPELTAVAKQRVAAKPPRRADDPEDQGLSERCITPTWNNMESAIGPPMLPNLVCCNFYQIVQTPGFFVIMSETFNTVRVVRVGGRHLPPTLRPWVGDSIAHWEGDTLVVDTTNVSPHTRFKESTERLHVVERFRRTDPQTLVYTFTVNDPDTWTQPWTAEILFKATDARIFEFACHEANYSLANVLRGARVRDQSSRN